MTKSTPRLNEVHCVQIIVLLEEGVSQSQIAGRMNILISLLSLEFWLVIERQVNFLKEEDKIENK